MTTHVTKRIDEFVPSNRWIASLSNGETIFEDKRPNMKSSWERLADYVSENDISITQLRIQFANGSEVKLPANAPGYIHKKKAWSTGAYGGGYLCIGYADSGLSLIHELTTDMGSVTKYEKDPGPPWTIYRKDIRESKYANT